MATFAFNFARRAAIAALATGLTAPALAADGYELIGFGPRQKALGGAGAADSRDAMSMSLNPAGIVGLERSFQIGVAAIMPERGYRSEGLPFVLAPGDVRSGRSIFASGNAAYVQPIDPDSAWGLVTYSHGGINTAYGFENFKPGLVAPSLGGPLGGGFAGFDNQQQYFSFVYARRFGPLSIGVAPTFAVQMLNVQGLAPLAPLSRNPSAVSDRGDDWSFGGGVRVGLQYEITPGLRVAVEGSTPMYMTPFNKYAGLLAQGGAFDLAAHVGAGVAYDFTAELTVMADWKHIFYGSVPTLANASFPIMPGGPGSWNGPGFGLHDIDAEALGVEWRATRDLTLRAGYRHSSAPFGSADVTLNVLAPGISEHHASGGFNYRLTQNSSIDVAFIHAFKNSISGYETTPFAIIADAPVPPQVNFGARNTVWLRGSEVSIGYNYRFDAADTGLLPAHF